LATLHWNTVASQSPMEGGQSYPGWPKLPQFTVEEVFTKSVDE